MRFLQHLHAPLPRAYQVTADVLFTTDLRWAFGDDDPDLDHIRRLVADAAQWGVELPPKETGYRFAKMLRRYAERFHARPDQPDLLNGLVQGVELARTMPFEVDFWAPQNILFDVAKTTLPQMEEQAQPGSPVAGGWLADYLRLAESLGVAVDELKKKIDAILQSPTVQALADRVWLEGRVPRATYRLQLHAGFPLTAAAAVVP